jgi:CheY-like chemotaxis protein
MKDFLNKVDQAYSASEALDKINLKLNNSSCCPKFLMIFTDLEMPVMNGYLFSLKVRDLYSNSSPPLPNIICCSGYRKEEDSRITSKAFDDCLQKPILKIALMRLMENYLSETIYNSQ